MKEDAKIHFDKRTGDFHFLYTFESPKLADPEPTFQSKRVVSNDPGVRAFRTFYSPTSGEYGVILDKFQTQIESRLHKLDRLQSRIAQPTEHRKAPKPASRQWYQTTRALKKKLTRACRRHSGWVESAHYDAASFPVSKYDVVIRCPKQIETC